MPRRPRSLRGPDEAPDTSARPRRPGRPRQSPRPAAAALCARDKDPRLSGGIRLRPAATRPCARLPPLRPPATAAAPRRSLGTLGDVAERLAPRSSLCEELKQLLSFVRSRWFPKCTPPPGLSPRFAETLAVPALGARALKTPRWRPSLGRSMLSSRDILVAERAGEDSRGIWRRASSPKRVSGLRF